VKGAILEFLESRGGLVTAWRAFAGEEVPRRRAWLYTLGSAALVAFLVQVVTGLVLALYYAPTPDHAHASVKAIETALPGGSLVRSLHHWGSSAMVILAVLHLLRTFLSGSYKKPRELNWLSGVGLLLLVLGFGFTGYLLPWDQKAYWATVVGTKVPLAAPVFGPLAAKIMAGGDSVGAYTLTRFYTIHVILLPLLTFGLIAAHLLLLRRHGHAGPAKPPDPREPFFPSQVARDGIVALAVVLSLFALAASRPAPLEPVADPSDTAYVPRPEWYFLPLFQLLKYFKGPLEPIGTAVLPGIAVLLLALVPWLDRSGDRRVGARKLVVLGGAGATSVALVLLFLGAAGAPKARSRSALDPSAEAPPDPKLLYGAQAYTRRGCESCHGVGGTVAAGSAEKFGLLGRPGTLPLEKLESHVKEKSPSAPPPSPEGGANDPDKDIPSLLAFTSRLSQGPLDLSRVPARVREGGAIVEREECRSCHEVYGEGGHKGPSLKGLLGRRDATWLVAHFKDPKALVPKSRMPSFRDLPEADLAAMADFLLALP
jgi:ubiquinol-cytochrome c reductase cytochrome b subunit